MRASINKQEAERKRFIIYNLCAWPCSIIITLANFLVYKNNSLPDYLMPAFSNKKCYFLNPSNDNYGQLIFLTVPIALYTLCNIYLFTRTIIYCIRVRNEVDRMKDVGKEKKKFQANKERLVLMLKLFIIMGIVWVFEVISSFYSFEKNRYLKDVEIVFDIFTSSQGVYIFCIFMLKKKIWLEIRKKIGWKIENKSEIESSMVTNMSIKSNVEMKGNVVSRM